jgi:hypothetical protein
VLGTLSSNGVLLAIAAGIGFAVAAFLFVGLVRGAPRILVALLALGAVVAIAIGIWAVVRPTSGIAETPMVAATPLSTPTGSPLPPGSPAPSPRPSPSPSPSASAPATPEGCSPAAPSTQLTEVVQDIAYQSPCLGAPAQQAFTISFDNKDAGTPHNLHIFSTDPITDPSATSLFMGAIVTGPATQTYDVPALPAGHYFFHCDVHPTTMKGELIVGP